MERYIVESPHTAGDCKKALKDVLAAGYLSRFDWGCADGDHRGWVVIEAENAKEAMMIVPSRYRQEAKVIKLTKFTREQIEKLNIE